LLNVKETVYTMANEEHLQILKKGVETWNQWRKENPYLVPDLDSADLNDADLREADLIGAILIAANLRNANLSEAVLMAADLREADLCGADLSFAELMAVDLLDAELNGADLTGAQLITARFYGTDLRGANLTLAKLGATVFGQVDLSTVEGLENVEHNGPSTIGIDTIYASKGKIPEIFLRGAGVPEPFIANMKSLVAAMSPIDFYSCFISYSSKDQDFADRLYADLQAKGVRCWFAPKDLKIGDPFRQRIDEAIRRYDKLLVVLSETSVASTWVESEVEAALERERQGAGTVLFPIRLDDAVRKTDKAWAADIRRKRHMGDFSQWQDHNSYRKSFERLLRDLQGTKTED
jgi:hypothetical protein